VVVGAFFAVEEAAGAALEVVEAGGFFAPGTGSLDPSSVPADAAFAGAAAFSFFAASKAFSFLAVLTASGFLLPLTGFPPHWDSPNDIAPKKSTHARRNLLWIIVL